MPLSGCLRGRPEGGRPASICPDGTAFSGGTGRSASAGNARAGRAASADPTGYFRRRSRTVPGNAPHHCVPSCPSSAHHPHAILWPSRRDGAGAGDAAVQVRKGVNVRLLTITGPGEVGKTRLCGRSGPAACSLVWRERHLCSARRPSGSALHTRAIADALRIPRHSQDSRHPDAPGGDPLEQIALALSERPPALLLLDNF